MSLSLFFHQVVNRTETVWGLAGGILGRKSLAPAGEMKVSIVPGEITTLLSCRLQLERTAARTGKRGEKKFLGQNRRHSAAEIITIVS